MASLLQIRRDLDDLGDAGADVDHYDTYVSAWLQMLLNYPNHWQAAASGGVAFPKSDLDHLAGLATLLDMTPRRVLPAGGQDLLRKTIADAKTLLIEDTSLSSQLQTYLVRLIREIERALEDEALGDEFDYLAKAEDLWVALQAAAGQSRGKKTGWKAAAARLLIPAAGGVLTHAGELGLDGIQQALGR
ncbi:hypothetical protein [Frondihabitans sp. Leaf304]|uniref:hypothetical protein n=1 Tax=Frondihabitans sp. Leaf304 TaxID=1736329 RepID=UPI0012F97920|nr:hypothetical protein [Frondihabitans sp. Leaf304]